MPAQHLQARVGDVTSLERLGCLRETFALMILVRTESI